MFPFVFNVIIMESITVLIIEFLKTTFEFEGFSKRVISRKYIFILDYFKEIEKNLFRCFYKHKHNNITLT